jgi:tRNA modification GTPase
MRTVAAELAADLARPTAEKLKDGIRVVIAGPPNAGKSTLLNALAGRDAAIVSPIAGTTRDIIEVPLALGGTAFVLTDTAGLREAQDDPIEAIGMARANDMLSAADIILWLGTPSDAPTVGGQVILVGAKSDLVEPANGGSDSANVLTVSAITGQGMDALIAALQAAAEGLLPAPGDYALSLRQREAMARAHMSLVEGAELQDEILIAEALRSALTALDELTGRATTEAVLDELFSGFCIGK